MKVKALLISLLIAALLLSSAYAVIRIDITSPGRKLPIAVSDLAGPYGKDISGIIRDDLEFTGLFYIVNGDAFIERPTEPFNRANWTITGAESVLKGKASLKGTIVAVVSLYDTSDGTAIFQKEYEADKSLMRQLAHGIAGDIYGRLTGKTGVFRTKIAFIAPAGAEKELCITDWDGQRVIRTGVKAPRILTPRWSRDGTKLLYSARRESGWGVYMLDLTGGTGEKRVYASGGIVLAGDFFPSGDAIVLSSSEKGAPDIYSYALSSGEKRKLTSTRGIEVSPAVSPDGGAIAFVSDRGGSPQVYTMDLNGYNINRITFEGSYNTSPAWSPAGGLMAFVGRFEGRSQIFTVSPDGSDLRRLTGEGNNEDPSFSPDGRYISFTSDRRGGKGIYVMRADGEGQKAITEKIPGASGPRWSPD